MICMSIITSFRLSSVNWSELGHYLLEFGVLNDEFLGDLFFYVFLLASMSFLQVGHGKWW